MVMSRNKDRTSLSHKQVGCPDGRLRRLWSLFREGLCYFAQVVQRHTLCLGFTFIPDTRCT